jgi:hypothetical protein
VGHALCAAILDIIEDNPYSRIPLSTYKTTGNIRNDLELNLSKYENGAMVPPAERFKNTTNRMAAAALQRKTTLTGSAAAPAKKEAKASAAGSNWIKEAKKNSSAGPSKSGGGAKAK